jgi:hypothetical protein
MNRSNNRIKNPQDSNVYRKAICFLHPTPSGSYHVLCAFFYKHTIPTGLESKIQNNLEGLSYEL